MRRWITTAGITLLIIGCAQEQIVVEPAEVDGDHDGVSAGYECDDEDPETTALCVFGDACTFDTQCTTSLCADDTCGCSGSWTGDACDVCPSNMAGADCDSCANGWTGANCDICAPTWDGEDCDRCQPNWTGDQCDACSAAWTGDDCSICPPNRVEETCDACKPNWMGEHCDQCSNGWVGESCDVCPPNREGDNCEDCSTDFVGDFCLPKGMIPIQPGTFVMGSPEDELGRKSDETQHEVTLTHHFALGQTEVTQAQWLLLVDDNPSFSPSCGVDCPVERITWWDALTYLNALSVARGLPPCYTLHGCQEEFPGLKCTDVTVASPDGSPYGCEGFRLPTEAEWEYAYRAGTTTAYYNGVNSDTLCNEPMMNPIGWYCGNAFYKTHPVGLKDPNPWGLYDMAGNVWEWVWDWYDGDYPAESVVDPHGLDTGTWKLFRGCGRYCKAYRCRAANRYGSGPGGNGGHLGFRAAMTIPPHGIVDP